MTDPLKLRRKLILLFLVLSLAPLAIMTYITGRERERRVHDRITGHLKSIVEKDACLLDNFLGERLADMKVLSKAVFAGGMREPEVLAAYLRAMRNEYKVYRQVSVVDQDGNIIAGDGIGEHEDRDIPAAAWFREAMSGRDYIGDVFPSRRDHEPVVFVSTCIKDEKGGARGVTAAYIDFGYVNGVLGSMELGKTGEAYLINKAGYFLTHSKLGGRILEDRIPASQERVYLGDSGIDELVDYRGKAVLSVHEWVPNRPWVLVAEQDSDEAFKEVHVFQWMSIFMTIAVALIVFGVAFVVSGKVAERLQKSYDKVQRVEKLSSLGTLIAGVAHELNTPLANILLNAQMLTEEIQQGEPASVDTLKIIESQARQGSNIVSALLEFSRQSNLVSEIADVNEILDNTFEITENQLRLSNIALVKEFDRGIPRMRTDIGKLQQVFVNIISNGIWAMPGGGELRVRTRFDPQAKRIEVVFSDTGCGISRENLGRIFDPFFTTKEAGKGTGLGLAVSHGIIEGMGGSIEASSVPAEKGSAGRSGTTFIVKLPISDGLVGDKSS
jgi:two-component system NtrC family sensor kinase